MGELLTQGLKNAGTITESAIAGGINALYTNWLNKKNAERNQKYWDIQNQTLYQQSEQAADNAMKRSLDMYNLTQSPAAMVQQLKEAGLSIGMMYGKGGMGGHTVSGPQGQAQGGQGAPSLGLQNLVDPLTLAQIKNINADTKNKEQDTKNKETQNQTELLNQEVTRVNKEFLQIELQIRQNDLTISNETIDAQIQTIVNQADLAYQEVLEKYYQNEITYETFEEQVEKIKQESINTVTQGEILKLQKEQIKAITNNTKIDTKEKEQKIQNMKMEYAVLQRQVVLTANQINLTHYQALNEQEKTKLIQAEATKIVEELANKYGYNLTKEDCFRLLETIVGQGVLGAIITKNPKKALPKK